MTFAEKLAANAADVENTLVALLDQQAAAWKAAGAGPSRLIDAMRYAVLGGGKRIRPFLVTETARLFGIPSERAKFAGAALELIHCYSLVHDDLPAMDNDELRRGRPTVWKAFDDWTAILAGDALSTLAFEVLARPETHDDPNVRIELVSGLARASGASGMAGGQALDLLADKLGLPASPTAPYIRHLQSMKTGALLKFACEAGAILGQASASDRSGLVRYGEAVGLAFQIADDLLDAEGDVATVGKAVAKDAAANKATLVSLMGVEAARAMLAETKAAAQAALEPFGERAPALREAAAFIANRQS